MNGVGEKGKWSLSNVSHYPMFPSWNTGMLGGWEVSQLEIVPMSYDGPVGI